MNRKPLFLSTLLFTITALILSSCVVDNKSNPNQDSQTRNRAVNAKVWTKLDSDIFGTPSFSYQPIISRDKKWLYVPARPHSIDIRAFELDGDSAKNINSKTKWTKLTLEDNSFDDSPGKAQLKNQGTFQTLNASLEGLLVAWDGDNSLTSPPGAAYFRGNKLALAFISDGSHVQGITNGARFGTFFTIDNNGTEKPYLQSSNKLFTHAGLKAEKFSVESKGLYPAANSSYASAKFAQGENKGLLVTKSGIYKIDESKAGTTQAFIKTKPASDWDMGVAGVQNFNVSSVIVAKNKLYVAFYSINDGQGGVAIYDIASGTMIPPKKSIWNKIAVNSLTSDKDDNVWAIIRLQDRNIF